MSINNSQEILKIYQTQLILAIKEAQGYNVKIPEKELKTLNREILAALPEIHQNSELWQPANNFFTQVKNINQSFR